MRPHSKAPVASTTLARKRVEPGGRQPSKKTFETRHPSQRPRKGGPSLRNMFNLEAKSGSSVEGEFRRISRFSEEKEIAKII